MEVCKRNEGCKAPADSGHWCPASPEQVRKLGYPEPCPYTVGKRACVAGARGHAGSHDWPAPGKVTEYPMSPFTRRALARELPAKAVQR